MLGAHFKITSNVKNPVEKQKQWGKAKKDNEEFHNPIVYFYPLARVPFYSKEKAHHGSRD